MCVFGRAHSLLSCSSQTLQPNILVLSEAEALFSKCADTTEEEVLMTIVIDVLIASFVHADIQTHANPPQQIKTLKDHF